MKGKVLDYSIQSNQGVILGEDGQHYNFVTQEWKLSVPPQRDIEVNFVAQNDTAIAIYPENNVSMQPTSQQQYHPQSGHNMPNREVEDYSPFGWFMKCIKNYANFSGRARRKEFWYFSLIYLVGTIGLLIVEAMLSSDGVLSALFILALWIPQIAVTARRLHDIDKSGWWQLISNIPVVGLILLFWLAKEGQPEANRYGEPPK